MHLIIKVKEGDMSEDVLKMLVEMAAADGKITSEERSQLEQKALELGISTAQLENFINYFLNKNHIQNNKQSGFITDDDEEKSGFINSKNENNAESGFISEGNNKNDFSGFHTHNEDSNNNNLNSGFNTDNIKPDESQPEYSNGFTNIELLSEQGAMSSVYKAKRHGKWIVIKRLKKEFINNAQYRKLFNQEFDNAFDLNHPNIVSLYDKGKDKGGPFYYMEYVDGRSLDKLIGKKGIEDGMLIKQISLQILDALMYVHKRQLFHRDLKPQNILITYKGDNVKLVDFGLALADDFEDNLLQAGTPKYAAPEQQTQSNTIDAKADIYSFGLILNEMTTGKIFDFQALKKRSPELVQIIKKCTEKNPYERFGSCQEIIECLQDIEIKNLSPELFVKNKKIDFGKIEIHNSKKYAILEIENSGFGTLKWTANTTNDQLVLSVVDGKLKIKPCPEKTGEFDAKIHITGNGGDTEIQVNAHAYNPYIKILKIAAMSIIGIAIIVGAVFLTQRLAVKEPELWNSAISINSVKSYDSYLEKFPKGKHANDARAKRDELIKENRLWKRAEKSRSIDDYRDYIRTYPKGRYAKYADSRINALKIEDKKAGEDKDWSKTLVLDNSNAYKEYLANYPHGHYRLIATAKLDSIKHVNEKRKLLNPKNRPIEVVRTFLNDLGNKRFESAFKKTKNPKWSSYAHFASRKGFGGIKKIKIISVILLNEDGLKSLVLAEYIAFDLENNNEKHYKIKYHLDAIEGEWKITGTELFEVKDID